MRWCGGSEGEGGWCCSNTIQGWQRGGWREWRGGDDVIGMLQNLSRPQEIPHHVDYPHSFGSHPPQTPFCPSHTLHTLVPSSGPTATLNPCHTLDSLSIPYPCWLSGPQCYAPGTTMKIKDPLPSPEEHCRCNGQLAHKIFHCRYPAVMLPIVMPSETRS